MSIEEKYDFKELLAFLKKEKKTKADYKKQTNKLLEYTCDVSNGDLLPDSVPAEFFDRSISFAQGKELSSKEKIRAALKFKGAIVLFCAEVEKAGSLQIEKGQTVALLHKIFPSLFDQETKKIFLEGFLPDYISYGLSEGGEVFLSDLLLEKNEKGLARITAESLDQAYDEVPEAIFEALDDFIPRLLDVCKDPKVPFLAKEGVLSGMRRIALYQPAALDRYWFVMAGHSLSSSCDERVTEALAEIADLISEAPTRGPAVRRKKTAVKPKGLEP